MSTKKVKLKKDSWIELFVFGVAFSSPEVRPVLILKDKEEKNTLPVWISPLEASLVMEEIDPQSIGGHPHMVSQQILKELDIDVNKCFFSEVKGHHQFVHLEFTKTLAPKKFRADQVMSFCMNHGARFYAKKELIEECRLMQAELEGHMMEENVGIAERPEYLM